MEQNSIQQPDQISKLEAQPTQPEKTNVEEQKADQNNEQQQQQAATNTPVSVPGQQQQQQQQQSQQQQQQQQDQINKPKKFLRPEPVVCKNYKSLDDIIKSFPHLQSLKSVEEKDFSTVRDAVCVVMRSNNDDDIHKAIKYGVWCSTPPNNETLQKTFEEAEKEKKEIFLFYSVVKSGQFVGVARMKSNLKEETFPYWWHNTKWKGHFEIEWLFIKDVTYKNFENLNNAMGMSVIRSKDGTKLDWQQTGLKMIEIFQKAPKENTIFNDFELMDQREQYLRYQRQQLGHYQPHYMQMPHYYQQQYFYNDMMYQGQGGYQVYNQNYYPQQRMQNIYPPVQHQQQFYQFNKNVFPPQQNGQPYIQHQFQPQSRRDDKKQM